MNACKKSYPQTSRDSVINEAFKQAFRATSAAYGYFGVFHRIGTEVEMLEYLTNDILSREYLNDYVVEKTKNANPAKKREVMYKVRKSVQTIVRPGVVATWRGNKTAADVMKSSFELAVKTRLRFILDKEAEVKEYLDAGVENIVQPFLNELNDNICSNVLKYCLEPIIQAFEQCLLGFHAEVVDLTHLLEIYPERFHAEIFKLEVSFEQMSRGFLTKSQKILWQMYTTDLTPLQSIFESSNLTTYDVYLSVMDDIHTILHNAVHTLSVLCEPTIQIMIDRKTQKTNKTASAASAASTSSKSHTRIAENLNEIITKLNTDCKLVLNNRLCSLLTDSMEALVQEMIIAPSFELALQAKHLVSDKDMDQMILLHSLVETMVRDKLSEFLNDLLADVVAEAANRFNLITVQLIIDVDRSSNVVDAAATSSWETKSASVIMLTTKTRHANGIVEQTSAVTSQDTSTSTSTTTTNSASNMSSSSNALLSTTPALGDTDVTPAEITSSASPETTTTPAASTTSVPLAPTEAFAASDKAEASNIRSQSPDTEAQTERKTTTATDAAN